MNPLPTLFLSHGSPMRAVEPGPAGAAWKAIADALPRPRAVLMVSAHWETGMPIVTASAKPDTIHDFGGFPDALYRIRYPAPGSPALAQRVQGLLRSAGIAAREDAERGFDHGMYAPMVVSYPEADMPTVQLSLKRGLDPQDHLALGRALAPLRDEDVLIIGSGLSYHNLRSFGPQAKGPSAAFDAWLDESLAAPGAPRSAALAAWAQAPSARQAHPREEHLLPLMVAVGAAESDPAQRVYHEAGFFGGITVSSWRFGAPAA